MAHVRGVESDAWLQPCYGEARRKPLIFDHAVERVYCPGSQLPASHKDASTCARAVHSWICSMSLGRNGVRIASAALNQEWIGATQRGPRQNNDKAEESDRLVQSERSGQSEQIDVNRDTRFVAFNE